MRRFVLLALAVLVAAAVASGSSSKLLREQTRVACGAKALSILFWPQGHPAIPSVNFPSFPPPHLEIYRTGAGYPGANFLGYLGQSGQASFRPTCKVLSTPLIHGRIAAAKTERNQTALMCTFSSAPQLDGIAVTGGARLLVFVPPKTVAVAAYIRATGSTITFNSRFCRPTPSPA